MKTKLSELASIAEIIGAFAVVISLIYVGVQVNDSAVNEELADQVWEAWDAGRIFDFEAAFMWLWIAYNGD